MQGEDSEIILYRAKCDNKYFNGIICLLYILNVVLTLETKKKMGKGSCIIASIK